jgi:2-polyprenyl-3-methyl-5-hydroxy-6-metoxy-1,4-benzoquinol methylase
MSARGGTWEEAVLWLRAQPDQIELVRACFYDDPLSEAAERYYASSEWEAARTLTGPAGGRALDVGAGRGISSYALARDGWQVTALEPDPSAVVGTGAIEQLAATSRLPIAVVQEWGEALPFPDASFELVYGREVLHHARDLSTLCAEMARVLKPGGTFLATREHVIFKDADLATFLAEHPLHWLYGGEHAYRLREYKDAIEGAGIRLTRVINPWASAVNLYPRSALEIGRLIHARLPFVPVSLVRPWLLRQVGWLLRSPGTAYSFAGVRA